MTALLVIIQIVLSLIFLLAAISKFSAPDELTTSLRLSHIPKVFIRPLVIATPICELVLATGLVLSPPSLLRPVMATAAGLLALFTIWMIWVYARKLHLKCGCFKNSGTNVGPRTITRNILLIILAIGGISLTLHIQSPLSSQYLWLSMSIVALIITALALALLRNKQTTSPSARDAFATIPSRRAFIKWLVVGVSAVLSGIEIKPVFALSPCTRSHRCSCYPDSWTEHICDCDCAGHPSSYCYGPVYQYTAYNCCTPDEPVECVVYSEYLYHSVCQYCP